jgi:hypothetical protein
MCRMPVGALVPHEADGKAFDRKWRLQHLQAFGALTHQPLRHRGDKVGAGDELGHEKGARRRYRDAALAPQFAKGRIDRPGDTAT